MLTNEVARIL